MVDFIQLVVAAKEVELELKALDENNFSRTIEELCNDDTTGEMWLKYTQSNWMNYGIIANNQFHMISAILRTAIGLKTLLTPVMNGNDLEMNLRPRLGWRHLKAFVNDFPSFKM